MIDSGKVEDSVNKNTYSYVIIGNDQSWLTQAVSDYLREKNLKCCLDEAISDSDEDKIYINCSSKEITGIRGGGNIYLDLAFYMQLCYFDFPEYHLIEKKIKAVKKENESKIEGIITGMSYFRDAVDVDIMRHPAVNVARSSEDLFFDLLELVQNYSETMKWAVMGLAPYSLNYDEALSKVQNYRLCAYIHKHGKIAQRGVEAYSGLLALKEYIIGYLGNDIFEYVFWNGYVRSQEIEKYDMAACFNPGCVRLEEQFEISKQYENRYPTTIEMNKELVKEYINFCSIKKLKLLIVIPPFSEWYKANWNQSYKDELIDYLQDLVNDYDFEFLDLSAQILEDDCFRNASHVNSNGQAAVTDVIDRWIDSKFNTAECEESEILALYNSILEHSIECANKMYNLKKEKTWEEIIAELTNARELSDELQVNEEMVISAYNLMDELQKECYKAYIEINSQNAMKREKKESPFIGRGVVYTCITGAYDDIKIPQFKDDTLDYVLFTDQKDLKSDFWKVRYIENSEQLSNVKLARKHKILAHKYLSEYDFSIYIDGKVQIVGNLREYIDVYSRGSGMLCFPHFFRDDIEEELSELIKLGKGDADEMSIQVANYLNEGFPNHFGMTDTCVLVRNHRDEKLNCVMEIWWNEILKGSHRDQLSFTYSCWKKGYVYDICDLLVMDNAYVCAGEH